jgi:transcriptional regulator of heat shock response
MRFYTKLIHRTLALEGWFEKPKNRLFGKIRLVGPTASNYQSTMEFIDFIFVNYILT